MAYSGGGTVRWIGSDFPTMPRRFKVDKDNGTAYEAVKRAIVRDRGLVLLGPVGAGKTVLAAEAAFWLASRAGKIRYPVRAPWIAEPCWWTRAIDFVQDVRRGWKLDGQWKDWGPDYSADGLASRVPRLFVDDLGAEVGFGSPAQRDVALEAIVVMLTARLEAGRPTWFTSNLEMAELQGIYGERLVSRIRGACDVVRLSGSDRRLGGAK
jgi:DNA replication protein DnaC